MTGPIEHIHISGVGGSAMAPLAGMLAERGYRVSGSDVGVYPPASTLLSAMGISWKEGFSEQNLQPHPDLVVIANALSRGNPEVEYVLDQKIPYKSLPEMLKEFFLPGHTSIVVSGTHGKTTTTSMLAWIFQVAGRQPNFLMGGVAENFGKSYGLGGGEEFILEGDEYDSAFFDKGPKFLHYRPDELIITSLEFDHADIYGDLAAIELQFRRLVNLVPRRGRMVACVDAAQPGSDAVARCVSQALCPVETYSLDGKADWCAGDIEFSEGATHFRAAFRGREVARAQMAAVGRHNVLNALAAVAMAHGRGIPREAIEEALAAYRSVRRRMEIKGEAAGVIVVDDFAHHPTAIHETIAAARVRFAGRRLWAVIEPRSNTMRRKVFQEALPGVLAAADGVVIGPVNRPKLLSDEERLSPDRVVEELRKGKRAAWAFGSATEIVDFLPTQLREGDVVLVMSNGNFDGLCEKLVERLRQPRGTGAAR